MHIVILRVQYIVPRASQRESSAKEEKRLWDVSEVQYCIPHSGKFSPVPFFGCAVQGDISAGHFFSHVHVG